jgi:hypothetical protein
VRVCMVSRQAGYLGIGAAGSKHGPVWTESGRGSGSLMAMKGVKEMPLPKVQHLRRRAPAVLMASSLMHPRRFALLPRTEARNAASPSFLPASAPSRWHPQKR